MPKRKIGEDRVSKITYKKGQVVVSFDEHKKVTMSENSFTDFALYVGKEMSSNEMGKIIDSVSIDKLMNYALKLVSKDLYSEHDIRLKLIDKGADQPTIKKIIAKLKEYKFIDDVTFAKGYANELADLRHYGKKRVIYNLEFHGIPEHIIEELEFSEERELERAKAYCQILDRKYGKTANNAKRQKAIKACMERGFSHHISAEAAETLTPTDTDTEKKELKKAYEACKAKYSKKYEGYDLTRRIYAYLGQKGYRYEDVRELIEEDFE
ncbi:MAG: RecX family transcriptional regulator [Bacilli bacterium]|nr:RecX family transcriptional regulator [Bacilli bacterium]